MVLTRSRLDSEGPQPLRRALGIKLKNGHDKALVLPCETGRTRRRSFLLSPRHSPTIGDSPMKPNKETLIAGLALVVVLGFAELVYTRWPASRAAAGWAKP